MPSAAPVPTFFTVPSPKRIGGIAPRRSSQLEADAAVVDVGRQDVDAEPHALGDGLGDALVRAGAR